MMLTVISPAKKLDYASSLKVKTYSQPRLLEDSKELLEGVKGTFAARCLCTDGPE